jgi:flavodoxin
MMLPGKCLLSKRVSSIKVLPKDVKTMIERLTIIKVTILICGMLFSLSPDLNAQKLSNKKILVVYLTRTQNTKTVAQIIQQKIAGDLVAIEPVTPYPDDYRTTVDQVAKENEKGYLPPIKSTIDNFEDYDTIFIGFPTWGMQLPPPIKTFLKQNSFKGKTIVPFNTNAGYGVGSGFEEIKKACKDAYVLEGYSVEGGKERDGILFVMKDKKLKSVSDQIDVWLKKIKLLK